MAKSEEMGDYKDPMRGKKIRKVGLAELIIVPFA